MAKPKLFQTATQDAKGFWWSEDADGNRYAVDPYQTDEFNGYRQVDRRFTEDTTTGAGLPTEAWRWQSGQVLTPQDMAQVAQIMSTPGAYVGVNGPMSVEQYLADPRSAIKVENGQYVYRPEQAQGDWESIDRESFMQSLGALPFVLGGFAAPYLSSLGVIGPGAGVMGSTGNMQFLGDVANVAGAAEGAAGAAGAATGNFTAELPMASNSYALAPEGLGSLAGDEFLNAMSEFVPGGLGAEQATAALTSASNIGGSPAADEFLNTMSEFVPGGQGAAQAAAATAASNIPQTASSALSQFLKNQLGIDASPGMLDLIGKGLGLGLGALGSSQQADATKELYNKFLDLGAPYRTSLAALESNPQGFYSSPMVQGALQQGSDALARSLSAKVGNPALNPTALQEMQNYTTRGLLDAYNNRFSQLAQAGQLGVGQSAQLGLNSSNSQGNMYNALGAGVQSVFGNQRDYAGEFMDLLRKNSSLGGFSLP